MFLLFFEQVIHFQRVDLLVESGQNLELKSRLALRVPFLLQRFFVMRSIAQT